MAEIQQESVKVVRENFKDSLRPRFISGILSTFLIYLAVQLALKLIEYWWNNYTNKNLLPPNDYVLGEPGYELDM